MLRRTECGSKQGLTHGKYGSEEINKWIFLTKTTQKKLLLEEGNGSSVNTNHDLETVRSNSKFPYHMFRPSPSSHQHREARALPPEHEGNLVDVVVTAPIEQGITVTTHGPGKNTVVDGAPKKDQKRKKAKDKDKVKKDYKEPSPESSEEFQRDILERVQKYSPSHGGVDHIDDDKSYSE